MSSSFCPKGQNKVQEKLSDYLFFLAPWQQKLAFISYIKPIFVVEQTLINLKCTGILYCECVDDTVIVSGKAALFSINDIVGL